MIINDTSFNGRLVERLVDNGDGTGTRTTFDDKGNVTSTEQVDGLPVVDIDPTHTVEDPLAAEVAELRAQNQALFAALDAAKVIDADAVRATAAGTKGDDALVLAVAKVLGVDPGEVRKKRDADPQWFADVVAKYGLDTDTKADSDNGEVVKDGLGARGV